MSGYLPPRGAHGGGGLISHSGPPGGAVGCALTTEGLLVELHKVGEDVFRDGLLVGETLEQNDHLGLADGVHALRRHVPTLPVYICGLKEQKSSQDTGYSYIRAINISFDPYKHCKRDRIFIRLSRV